MIVALLAVMPLTFYSGGYHLARNADGVLQVRSAHFAMGFMPFLLSFALRNYSRECSYP